MRRAGAAGDFLRERIFEPLGMKDTGFHVPRTKPDRLPTSYAQPRNAVRSTCRPPDASRYARAAIVPVRRWRSRLDGRRLPRVLPDAARKGRHGRERILSRAAVELMTTDQLTTAQKSAHAFLGPHRSWGFGLAVVTRRDDLFATPGRFGWDGGCGTSAWSDPAEDLVGILMTQRLMDVPQPPPAFADFWTSAYQAIDD